MQVGRTGPLPARRATRSRRYGPLMPIADARRRTARRLPALPVIFVASPWRFGARQRSSMPPRISVPRRPAARRRPSRRPPSGTSGRCRKGPDVRISGLPHDPCPLRTAGTHLHPCKIAQSAQHARRHAMRRSGSGPSQWAGNTWKRPATGTPSPACTGSCQTPPAGRRCGDAVAASTEPVRRTALSCAMQDRALPERGREFRFT